ncbi:MAG TPA: hypothetical protein PK803_06455 [Alphaproteobacteria bacterium]|nr:hypothetical protein [Alphaproteobacteria bacterium]
MKEDAYISGHLKTHASFADLIQSLSASAFNVEIRESAHYEGGRYIAIRSPGGNRWTVEYIAPGEYLLRADEGFLNKLVEFSRLLSGCFSKYRWQHRIEVYDGKDALQRYFHHDWPQGANVKKR